MYKVLLVGPPNAGKTTLFNALTGKHEKVGNFYGVTATVAEGFFKFKDKNFSLSDLPGIYTLTPYSLEEKSSINKLNQDYDCIICVIDGLYPLSGIALLKELKSLNKPIITLITKIKLLNDKGGGFNLNAFSQLTGVATVGEENVKQAVKKIKEQLYNGVNLKLKDFISREVLYKVYKPFKSKENKWLLNPFFCSAFCISVFLSVIILVFSSVSPISWFSKLLGQGFDLLGMVLGEKMLVAGVSDFIVAVSEKAIEGVGAVFSFMPQLIALNFFILIFEESGIACRFSLIFGRYLKGFGLSGKSVFPITSCLGCTALSCKLSNLAENQDVKKRTLTCFPFVPCSAKNTVLIFLCCKIFCKPVLALILIYLIEMLFLFTNAYIAQKRFPVKKQSTAYELAPFIFPNLKKFFICSVDGAVTFIKKIFCSVFLVGVAIGVTSSVSLSLNYTSNLQESMLGFIGSKVAVILKPIGLGDWRLAVSLISGLFAKESTLGVIEILYGENFYLSTVQGVCFVTFFILYPPCLVSLFAMETEQNKMGWYIFIKHTLFGYIGTFFVCILLTKRVLFSIIMLSIVLGCVVIYEIIYSKRKRKTFSQCRKRGCALRSLSQTVTQKRGKSQR